MPDKADGEERPDGLNSFAAALRGKLKLAVLGEFQGEPPVGVKLRKAGLAERNGDAGAFDEFEPTLEDKADPLPMPEDERTAVRGSEVGALRRYELDRDIGALLGVDEAEGSGAT